jgi:phage shock protein A
VRISEAATGVGEQMADVGLAMQRALDKTENMKARADAVGELEPPAPSTISPSSARRKDDIDRQLAARRRRRRRRRAVEDEGRARTRSRRRPPRPPMTARRNDRPHLQ